MPPSTVPAAMWRRVWVGRLQRDAASAPLRLLLSSPAFARFCGTHPSLAPLARRLERRHEERAADAVRKALRCPSARLGVARPAENAAIAFVPPGHPTWSADNGAAAFPMQAAGDRHEPDDSFSTPPPSRGVRVRLDGLADGHRHALLALLRPYGRVLVLEVHKGEASARFLGRSAAAAAVFCLQGMPPELLAEKGLPSAGGPLFTRFADPDRGALTRVAEVASSPRMIPLLLVLVIGAAALVLAPFRMVTVFTSLAGRDEPADQDDAGAGAAGGAASGLPPSPPSASADAVVAALTESMASRPSSLLVVLGAPGSGKTAAVRRALGRRRYTAVVDCRAEEDAARGAEYSRAFLEALQDATGFAPRLDLLTGVLQFVQAAMPAGGGKGSDLVPTSAAGLDTVLDTLALAVRPAPHPGAVVVFDSAEELAGRAERAVAERVLAFAAETAVVRRSAHVVLVTDNALLAEDVAARPSLRGSVRVLHLGDSTRDEAAAWLTAVTGAREEEPAGEGRDKEPDADDAGGGKELPRRGLPSMPSVPVWSLLARIRGLATTTPAARGPAAAVLARGAGPPPRPTPEEVEDAVRAVGGRRSDLLSLVRRWRGGQALADAVQDMRQEGESRLLSRGFGGRSYRPAGDGEHQRQWDASALWRTMCALAERERLPADAAVRGELGSDAALAALVDSRLLYVRSDYGLGSAGAGPTVEMASPLMLGTARALSARSGFADKMWSDVRDAKMGKLDAQAGAIEDEMARLYASGASGPAKRLRRAVLEERLAEVAEASNKVRGWGRSVAARR